MTYTREDIIAKLEAYPSMQEKIALLRYELEHPASISPDEMLQEMSFTHPEGMGHPTGTVSNKTLYIAINVPDGAGFFRWASRFDPGILTDFKEKRCGTAEKAPSFGHVDIFQTRPKRHYAKIAQVNGIIKRKYRWGYYTWNGTKKAVTETSLVFMSCLTKI